MSIFSKKLAAMMAVFGAIGVGAAGAVSVSNPGSLAYATNPLTARPSVWAATAARLPTSGIAIAGNLAKNPTYYASSGYNVQCTNQYGAPGTPTECDKQCIDTYLTCIKGDDVCGSGFENCTTKVLFYGKQPTCASILLQCTPNGINELFGTTVRTDLSNFLCKTSSGTAVSNSGTCYTDPATGTPVPMLDANGNKQYTYPTDSSILGKMVEGAMVTNRLSTSDCVKKYTSCLHRDDVCGANFELCTDNKTFKAQKLFCDSIIARCETPGINELFGADVSTGDPTTTSRLGQMIIEGGKLAAVNAVATCYKVADQCFLSACQPNPYNCIVADQPGGLSSQYNELARKLSESVFNMKGTSINAMMIDAETFNGFVKILNSLSTDLTTLNSTPTPTIMGGTQASVKAFLQNQCLDTIGGNKYCYATTIGAGKMPSDSDIRDQDNRLEIFNQVFGGGDGFAGRFNDSMKSKIDDMLVKFDAKIRAKCQDTLIQCAMGSCGDGSGPACYMSAFGSMPGQQSVSNSNTRQAIRNGCSAIVNADTSCQYAAVVFNGDAGDDVSVFDRVFPEFGTDLKNPDPVDAISVLDSKLSNSYNQAALDALKNQCVSAARSCIENQCGTDFTYCYRSRNDIMSTITSVTGTPAASGIGNQNVSKTDATKLGNQLATSMNKVGGILDRTIVLGLCADEVRNNPSCTEHLKVEVARNSALTRKDQTHTWGSGTSGGVGNTWLDAGKINVAVSQNQFQDYDGDGNMLCQDPNPPRMGACGTAICGTNAKGTDGYTCFYNTPFNITQTEYGIKRALDGLFATLIGDIEMKVQGIYNAKLTAQMNQCFAQNSGGGLMAAGDMGSTFLWAQLKSNTKLPKTYAVTGLPANGFKASNELYGSFCRVRVSMRFDGGRMDGATTQLAQKINDEILAKYGDAYFAVGDSFACGSWIPTDTMTAITDQLGATARDDKLYASHTKDDLTKYLGTIGAVIATGVGGYAATNVIQNVLKTGVDKNKTAGGQLGRAEECVNKARDAQTVCSLGKPMGQGSEYLKIVENDYNDCVAKRQTRFNEARQAASGVIDLDQDIVTAAKLDGDDGSSLLALINACQKQANTLRNSGADKNEPNKWVNLAGGAVTATAAGIFAYRQIEVAQDAARRAAATQAEKDAIDQWYNLIGTKLKCYIGSEQVGSFGQVIETSME